MIGIGRKNDQQIYFKPNDMVTINNKLGTTPASSI